MRPGQHRHREQRVPDRGHALHVEEDLGEPALPDVDLAERLVPPQQAKTVADGEHRHRAAEQGGLDQSPLTWIRPWSAPSGRAARIVVSTRAMTSSSVIPAARARSSHPTNSVRSSAWPARHRRGFR
ncbi:hypothetical protein [Salinispora pacifica]|uniref:hypothetical protein n=1 Tax=Salinispora pacifica TaxID=351187 RepID=UPI0004814F2C|nr:hypothetical protein [Salinispora pacifica]